MIILSTVLLIFLNGLISSMDNLTYRPWVKKYPLTNKLIDAILKT